VRQRATGRLPGAGRPGGTSRPGTRRRPAGAAGRDRPPARAPPGVEGAEEPGSRPGFAQAGGYLVAWISEPQRAGGRANPHPPPAPVDERPFRPCPWWKGSRRQQRERAHLDELIAGAFGVHRAHGAAPGGPARPLVVRFADQIGRRRARCSRVAKAVGCPDRTMPSSRDPPCSPSCQSAPCEGPLETSAHERLSAEAPCLRCCRPTIYRAIEPIECLQPWVVATFMATRPIRLEPNLNVSLDPDQRKHSPLDPTADPDDPLSSADRPGYTKEAISRLGKWPLTCTFNVGLTGFEPATP